METVHAVSGVYKGTLPARVEHIPYFGGPWEGAPWEGAPPPDGGGALDLYATPEAW